jgi:O-antigen chain-terminating methyltransferase
MIEHVSFDYLVALLREAYRIVAPGGLVILETPNPENLAMGTSAFYIDPTHQRPIPPPLLHFLLGDAGFSSVGILRLNTPAATLDGLGPIQRAAIALFADGPDYACLAQKPASLGGVDIIAPFVASLEAKPPLERLVQALGPLEAQARSGELDALRQNIADVAARAEAFERAARELSAELARAKDAMDKSRHRIGNIERETRRLQERDRRLSQDLRIKNADPDLRAGLWVARCLRWMLRPFGGSTTPETIPRKHRSRRGATLNEASTRPSGEVD